MKLNLKRRFLDWQEAQIRFNSYSDALQEITGDYEFGRLSRSGSVKLVVNKYTGELFEINVETSSYLPLPVNNMANSLLGYVAAFLGSNSNRQIPHAPETREEEREMVIDAVFVDMDIPGERRRQIESRRQGYLESGTSGSIGTRKEINPGSSLTKYRK